MQLGQEYGPESLNENYTWLEVNDVTFYSKEKVPTNLHNNVILSIYGLQLQIIPPYRLALNKSLLNRNSLNISVTAK